MSSPLVVASSSLVAVPNPLVAASSSLVVASSPFVVVPSPFVVGRYHSLVVEPGTVPEDLEVTATSPEGEVMAVRHRSNPTWGVQFHPESILTPCGDRLLGNFIELIGTHRAA